MPNVLKSISILVLFCGAASVFARTQELKTLVTFDGSNGAFSDAGVIQADNGGLYGATLGGGETETCPSGCGTVFRLPPSATLTTTYNFCELANCADGESPDSLVQAADGNFYGTTGGGGLYKCYNLGCGTVFKITPSGVFSTLYEFCPSGCGEGALVPGGLIAAADGNLYGVTTGGGANDWGSIFEVSPTGTLTTLHSFEVVDGAFPNTLIQASDGNFYGAAGAGGAYGYGTLFKMTPSGTLTTLHSFDLLDGSGPVGLVQAADGNLYGTTAAGGANDSGTCSPGCGTVFKINAAGDLITLYSFCSATDCADGSTPNRLIQGTDGNFYGTTVTGGAYQTCLDGCGTIFRLTAAGGFSTIYSFCAKAGCADGATPVAAPMQATDGAFYGTTQAGGEVNCGGSVTGCGTVYRLSVGLGPFVMTRPSFGTVGTGVTILGSDLTGATGVSFNGTPAVFTVVSGSEIKVTVPAGATSGIVEVSIAGRVLKSNAIFRVKP
ncbi:MAG: choice-of-anchor tandem repeat GloVer-containing protein [Candidatus Sulfotelmatobacter sp.]